MTVPKPIDTTAFDRITAGDLGRWAVAVVFIAALGSAGAMTLQRWSPAVAAQPAPEPVMLIDLAPLPAPEPEPVPDPPPEIEQPPVEQPIVEPPPVFPEPEPEPPVVEPPMAEPLVPQVEEPRPVVEPEVVPPPVEPVGTPKLEPTPEEAVVSDLLMPAMMSPELRQRRAETPPTPRAERAPTLRKPVEPTPRQKPAPQQPAAAEQPAAQATAPSVSPEQWQSQVLRRLDQRKVYPRAARDRGESGAVVVSFSVDASGRVSGVGIARSSGFPDLDQAAIETARRASPLPRPPAGFAGQSLSASIRFTLR